MKKRIISFIMAFVLLICIVPTVGISVDADVARYWPVPGHNYISSGYRPADRPDHDAIDIADGNINGATVIASVSGTVVATYYCTEFHPWSTETCDGFGTGLVIYGEDGRYYQYAHMQGGSMPNYVYNGAYVSAGSIIGRVGQTGAAAGPHLHFEVASTSNWYNGDVNPNSLGYGYTSIGTELLNIGDDFEAYIKFSATGHAVCNMNKNVQLGIYGSAESRWRFIRQSDNTYKIVSTLDGSVMDVSGGSSENGTNVQTYINNDYAAQRFYIQRIGDKYNIISSFCGKALVINGGINGTTGSNVAIYSQNGLGSQIFEIDKLTDVAAANCVNIGDDFEAYIKLPVTGHGVCNVNKNVQLGEYGGAESKWRFIRQSDNTYKIVSTLDGSVMDVSGGSSENGTNIQTYIDNNQAAQRFYIIKSGDKYNIISSFCGRAVAAEKGANSTTGTNIVLYSQTGLSGQEFEINKNCASHIYDNDNDTTCNICGEVRSVSVSGDINSDGVINNRDLALLMQFLNGWSVKISSASADVNADGAVNNKDYALILQYTNGWNVKLQ